MKQAQTRNHTGLVRVVSDVRWASLCTRPECIPTPKRQPSGAKGAGLRYERLFAKQFPQSLHGQWFEYEDKVGHGYCQTDLIVSFLPNCLVVFEVKYTLTNEAFLQLNNLYLPIVRAAMNAPVVGVVVAKNLINPPSSTIITPNLDCAIEQAFDGIPVLHWVGQNVCHTHPLKIKPPIPDFQIAFPARHIPNPSNPGDRSIA